MGACVAIKMQRVIADVTDRADFTRADQEVKCVVDGRQGQVGEALMQILINLIGGGMIVVFAQIIMDGLAL